MLLFLGMFSGFSLLFYLVLTWNVLQNVDEVLYNRKVNLMAYLEKNPEVPFSADNPLDDFTFYKIHKKAFSSGTESYTDTLVFEPVDQELDEYRKLTSYVQLNGIYYRLDIVKPHLEVAEIIGTIAITLTGLFLGLSLCYYISFRFISRKIWSPFYATLAQLGHYRLDREKTLVLPPTNIEEFKRLNNSITELTEKNKEIFKSQKQFIENASHEMQTPLSIIQSRLEALVGQAELTGEQAIILEGIISSTQRLKKLNKTLLLLSRIENRQFIATDKIDVIKIINKSLEFYEEQKSSLNVMVRIEKHSELIIKGNTLLTEILIQNLLKNAFLHNVRNGCIIISTTPNMMTITNTGRERKIEQEKIFNRFYKESNNPDTWGLGLAIAYKIADTNGWKLKYSRKNNLHAMELKFL